MTRRLGMRTTESTGALKMEMAHPRMETEGATYSRLRLELKFQCDYQINPFIRPAGSTPELALVSVRASIHRPGFGLMIVPPGMHAIALNLTGTFLAKSSGSHKLVLCPPKSVAFIRGGTRVTVQAARGDHETLFILWSAHTSPILDQYIEAHTTQKGIVFRPLASKPLEPSIQSIMTRLDQAIADPSDAQDPIVMSVVHEVVGRLLSGPDEIQLALIPAGLPELIVDLAKAVRSQPAASWPLREAADRAGYSPFHFSRVFKQLVGYGFHEFVDRCRSESAVELLVSTGQPVDVIASSCGFGTTQGLRESVKEYLGLVPSELRSLPETLVLP